MIRALLWYSKVFNKVWNRFYFFAPSKSPRDRETQPTLTPCGEKQLYHLDFSGLHLFPDQEEAARCGRLPGGSQSGLHPAGHRLQWGEPHVDEGQRSGGEQAQQRHPVASSDLQRGQLLWCKEPRARSETPRGKPEAACSWRLFMSVHAGLWHVLQCQGG